MNTPANHRERPQETPAGARSAPVAPQRFGAGADRLEWRDAVWESITLKPADKLVALAYEKFAGDGTTRVFVAPEVLHQLTGYSRSTYTLARSRLEVAGWLTVSEPARQNFSTRYALTLPADLSRPDTGPLRDAQPSGIRTPDTLSRPDFGPLETSAVRIPTPAVRIPTPAVRIPDPNTNHNYNPNHQPGPTVEHEQAPTQPLADVEGLVAEIRSQRLAAGLTAVTLTAHATKLRAAGWTPPALAAALAGQDLTGARGPGLLRHRLDDLARTGPTAPSTPPARDTTRCADHGTTGAATCSSCWSEVKTGERHPDDVGQVPRHHPETVPA